MLLSLLERSYASEIARALGASLRSVQTILTALEENRIVVGIPIGRERFYELNRRDPAYSELKNLLTSLAERDELVLAASASVRRSPRKRGKPI